MFATLCVAAALVGAQGFGGDDDRLGYQVRVFEMRGLDWRGQLHLELTPVARQGGASVWVAPKSTVVKLAGTSARTLPAPKPATGREVRASVRNTRRHSYVAHLERMADGPMGKATVLAYKPHIDTVDETFNVAVDCRRVDQGVLTQVAIDETRLVAMATYAIEEEVQPKDPDGAGKPTRLNAKIQVPELARGEVSGAWVVPLGHVLIVGLGLQATRDAGGSQVMERVVVVEPEAIAPQAAAHHGRAPSKPVGANAFAKPPEPIARAAFWTALPFPMPPAAAVMPGATSVVVSPLPNGAVVVVVPSANPLAPGSNSHAVPAGPINALGPVTVAPPAGPIPAAPVAFAAPLSPMPPLPTRALPTPINSKGEVVPLPPLPKPEKPADDESAEPRGSPQTVNPPTTNPEEKPDLDFDVVVNHCKRNDARSELLDAVFDSIVAFATQTGDSEGPECVFDMGGDDGAKGRLSVYIEADEAGKRLLMSHNWVITEAELAGQAKSQPAVALSLDEAIRLAVRQSPLTKLDEPQDAQMSGGPIVTCAVETSEWDKTRGLLAPLIRSVKQQYWALSEANVRCLAAQTALELCQQVVDREKEKSKESCDLSCVLEAEEQLERFRLEMMEATRELNAVERQFRSLIGMPAVDGEHFVPTSSPRTEEPNCDWDRCLAQMRDSHPDLCTSRRALMQTSSMLFHGSEPRESYEKLCRQAAYYTQLQDQATHQLARYHQEARSNHELYRAAGRLLQAARTRLEAQKAGYQTGTISNSRYLDAINRWMNAEAQQAHYLARYNVSLAVHEELKGTLDRVALVPVTPEFMQGLKRDPHLIRGIYSSGPAKSSNGSVRLSIGFGAFAPRPASSAEPSCVCIPLGTLGGVEVRVSKQKPNH